MVNCWKAMGFVIFLVVGRVELLKTIGFDVLGLQIYSGRANARERNLDLPSVWESKMCGEW